MNQTNTKQPTTTDYDALRHALADAGYDPITRDTLARLIDTAAAEGWSLAAVAANVGVSSTTISRLISGKYTASIDRSIGAVTAFLARYDSRKTVADIPFVETSIARKIWMGLDYAITYGEMVSIIGSTQWGKSWAIEEYQRRKMMAGDETVIIVDMPTNPSPTQFIAELCRALGITTRLTYAKSLEAVYNTLTSRHLLIIDECHEMATGLERGKQTIETIRRIYRVTKCAIALVGTNVWGRVLDGSLYPKWAAMIEQTVQRGINIQLPPALSYTDKQAVWRSFGLQDPDDTPRGKSYLAWVHDIVQACGLSRYTRRMRNAVTAARKAGRAVTWDDVLAVHRQLEILAGTVKP